MKILIADDDVVSRVLMTEILNSAQAGYEVVPADDGTQAWAALESQQDIKVAIFDLAMPGMTGIDLLKRARSDPRFTHLPIIVCTGTSDRATVTEAARHGVTGFVVKPFSRSAVLDKVAQICRPMAASLPVLSDLAAARQRYEVDRDAHRELLAHYVRVADLWATDARRATDYARVRALAIRATRLKQMLASLGAAAAAARFQEAEDTLSRYRTRPLPPELQQCLAKAHQFGEKIQVDIDRLREMLDTVG